MSSADEAAVPVDILKPEVPLTLDDSSTEQVETVIGADQHDQELLHELELALQKALRATTFEGLDDLRNTFLATTQLTTSNVISTIVTAIASIYRGYYLRSWIHRLVPKLKHDAAVQIQVLVRGSQARERVAMLLFERKCEERRRAGLPFQITLGSRVSIIHKNGLASDSSASSLSVLYENRKPRASLDFRTEKWQEDRKFLRIYVSVCIDLWLD
ncbi:hypothetical protein JG687_00017204 [Phytophthora cactorum]|uniref:Uncharacterized protein n=1 Tax=Phytophthora cactorum TaxID=29920 RepID=A0A8T1TQ34_9STRA|nr:hypothetical protein JG687_00017204 [Phytophthora cactorum]